MMQMKTGLLAAAGLLAGVSSAENLFPDGDFTRAEKSLAPHVFTNGGRVELFTEEYTWNRCGRLFSPQTDTNAQGVVTTMAGAVIGSDGKASGIPVRAGATYDFSVEVRGNTGAVGIGAAVWNAGIWKDGKFIKTTIPSSPRVKEKDWMTVRGSFTVPEGMTRAALYLQMWAQSTADKSCALGPASEFFFDNVTIKESADGFAPTGRKAKTVPVVKAIAPGVTFSDFLAYKNTTGCGGASAAGLTGRVEVKDDALLVGIEVRRPGGNVAGKASSPWSGDCLEVFVGAPVDDPARVFTQFAWNAAGATFARSGNRRSVDGFEVVKGGVTDGVWKSLVRIPFAAVGLKGLPKADEPLKFNVGFTGGGFASWSPVASGFGDVPKFGLLYCRGYAAALKAKWNVDESVADRAAFERRVAELETAAKQAELDRFKEATFTVTAVSGESDWAMPFVPRESFHPASNIHVRAAINERTGVPVAVLNTTEADETYVVRLETSTHDAKVPYADKEYNGTWGLAGFPAEQITMREAVPVKDTETAPVSTRLDPLPKMNEACTIRVAAHQAGLVWFDFDTKGVRPGTYRGRVRVIPLSQPSRFKSCGGYGKGLYEGKMQDVPLALEVLPFALADLPSLPTGFFQNPATEEQFDLMVAAGTREFQASPWDFGWKLGPDRNYDYAQPGDGVARACKGVKRVIAWARERGFTPTFFVGFGCFDSFGKGGGKSEAEALRLWPGWVKGVKRCMNEWGVPDSDFNLEVYDEPDPARYDEVKKVLALAKEAEPTVRLSLTIGAKLFSAEQMRGVFDQVDSWILWSTGCFEGADRRAFVRDALAAGKAVWHYTCTESSRNPVYGWYRLHPWYGLRHGLTGNQFYWFQNAWGGYGTTDFKNRLSSGIVLSSFGSTMPTLRYMAMRKGVTDLRYLDVLRTVAGDREEVRKFLSEVPLRVVETERHDVTAADRVRDEAVRLILKYQKQGRGDE